MRGLRGYHLCPEIALIQLSHVAVANATVKAANQQIAYKFYPDNAAAITAFDIIFTCTGTLTGITIKAHIETDSGGAPSGVAISGDTPAFACPATSTWTGLQTFATDSGALTPGTPYWLVLFDGGGTAPTSSNFWQARTATTAGHDGGAVRQHNGTNWTTTAISIGDGVFLLKHGSSGYSGVPGGVAAATTATGVYQKNLLAMSFQSSMPLLLRGVQLMMTVAGTPSNLEVLVFANGSQQGSTLTINSSDIINLYPSVYYFGSAIQVPANVPVYIILHQVSDGGSSLNNYKPWTIPVSSASYMPALCDANFQFLAGAYATSITPAVLSQRTTEMPSVFHAVIDSLADIVVPTYPAASKVYAGTDRGDGTLGTLHASNIATAAGAGENLAAGLLLTGHTVDDVTGSVTTTGGGTRAY